MRQVREPCYIDSCDALRVGHGLCGRHYQRWRKYGDPLFVKPNRGNRSVRVMPTERTCLDCAHRGPRAEFVNGRNICKPCKRARLRRWAIENPERHAALRERQKKSGATVRWNIRNRAAGAGVDPDWFESYYAAHHGLCEICGSSRRPGGRDLAIDHDHETGEFRGMLCDNCNRGLGQFKDDVEKLRMAIAYLESHKSNPVAPNAHDAPYARRPAVI